MLVANLPFAHGREAGIQHGGEHGLAHLQVSAQGANLFTVVLWNGVEAQGMEFAFYGICVLGCQLVGRRPFDDGFTRGRSGTKKVFLLGRIRHEPAGSEEKEHPNQVVAQF